MKSTITLKKAVESLRPLVSKLREIERDAVGIAYQYEGIGPREEGPERFLDAVQKKLDKRFESVVGKKFAGKDFADAGLVREVLKQIRKLAEIAGIENLDTSSLPQRRVERWTGSADAYVPMDRDDPERTRQESRYILAFKPRLNSDGSLRTNSKKR